MALLSVECQHRYSSDFSLDVAFETDALVTCLFGPSGSGKSCTLEIIAGLMCPDRAQISLGSRELVNHNANSFVAAEYRRVGVVFQDLLLFPHMSVHANLRYGMRRTAMIAERDVIDVLELGALLDRLPQRLSGGERQRVAIGRALLTQPQCLLLDEPVSALDRDRRETTLAYVERVSRQWQIPIVFVSHSQTDVHRLADWVVVMDDGRVISIGTPTDALSTNKTLGWKDESGPVNLMRIDRIERDQNVCRGYAGNHCLTLPRVPSRPDAAYVQFRPSDVVICQHTPTGLSARNHLSGTIRQVLTNGDMSVYLGVDIGHIVWAEVTQAAVDELNLKIGKSVTCLIKSSHLTMLD